MNAPRQSSRIAGLHLALALVLLVGASGAAMTLGDGARAVPLNRQVVEVTIDNQVAVTRVTETFVNTSQHTIEAVYTMPLAEKAAIQEFGITGADGVRQVGAVEEKREAEAIYSNAQAQGVTPAMVAPAADGNSFQTKVGAVLPGKRVTVDVTFSQILDYKSGRIVYQYPLQLKSVQVEKPELVSVRLKIRDQKKIVEVKSPTHPCSVVRKDDHAVEVTFEKGQWQPDHDFQVVYDVTAPRMGFNFLSTRPNEKEAGYFMMMLAPQEEIEAKDVAARDLVFVLDCSGSMQGQKIEQAQRALKYIVNRLNADDRFNLVTFSDGATARCGDGLVAATDLNRRAALAQVDAVGASGGTNAQDALQSGLRLFDGSSRTKALIFLTDGQPTVGETNPERIAAHARAANAAKVRVFTFGVGDDVSTPLLEQLARENRGEALTVRLNEDLDARLTAFYETISKPLLTDLAVDWQGVTVSALSPATLGNVYKGSQVVLFGRYVQPGAKKLVVTGDLNGKQCRFELEANFAAKSSDNLFVARLWAKAQADELVSHMRAYGEDAAKKAEVIRLSKQYGFASPYTSFVAVDPTPRPVQTASTLDRYRQPQPGVSPQVAPAVAMAPAASIDPAAFKPAMPMQPRQNITVVRTAAPKEVKVWGFLPGALMVPNFRQARESARGKACAANMRVIASAIEQYNMDHSGAMIPYNIEAPCEQLRQAGYLKSVPRCPADPTLPYMYVTMVDPQNPSAGFQDIYCPIHNRCDDLWADAKTPTNPHVQVAPATAGVQLWNMVQPLVELAINIPLLLLSFWLIYKMFQLVLLPFRLLFGTVVSPNR